MPSQTTPPMDGTHSRPEPSLVDLPFVLPKFQPGLRQWSFC